MKTKVYFRVDALKHMGMGHLIRCIALADLLTENFHCLFLTRAGNEERLKMIGAAGFDHFPMPTTFSGTSEAAWIKTICLEGTEIVVLDGYHFDTAYQSIIKSGAGKMVCIDDIHDTRFLADVIINHSGGIKEEDYNCTPGSKLFLGLDYLMIRPAFFKTQKKALKKGTIKNVLICLGGEDPHNDTFQVLKKCEVLSGIVTCKIVVGSVYAHLEKLKAACKSSQLNISLLQNLSAEEMVEVMQSCDTAICSPSTIALEYLTIGGNLFLHQIADNQKNVRRFFLSQGLAFSLENFGDIKEDKLIKALERQSEMIDGHSPQRLLKIFRQLENELTCHFRPARSEDMYQYYQWANEATTRQQSFNSNPITFNQHCSWFRNKLSDSNCCLYVLEYKGQAAGQIRFELDKEKATISYSLDQKFRGLGLSRILLKGGIEQLKLENSAVKNIKGFVKVENKPSIRTFQKLGFYQKPQGSTQLQFLQLV